MCLRSCCLDIVALGVHFVSSYIGIRYRVQLTCTFFFALARHFCWKSTPPSSVVAIFVLEGAFSVARPAHWEGAVLKPTPLSGVVATLSDADVRLLQSGRSSRAVTTFIGLLAFLDC